MKFRGRQCAPHRAPQQRRHRFLCSPYPFRELEFQVTSRSSGARAAINKSEISRRYPIRKSRLTRVSSGIVAAEVAPKMDLIVETEIACPHCGQSFPLPKASKARNSDCPRHWNRFGAPTRFAQFVGSNARNHCCKITEKQDCNHAMEKNVARARLRGIRTVHTLTRRQ